jgi:hypothetical protein
MMARLAASLRHMSLHGAPVLSASDEIGVQESGGLLVLLPSRGLSESHALAQHILLCAREARAVGLAIGVASAGPHGLDGHDLLAAACEAADRAATRRAPGVDLARFRWP